MDDLLTTRQVQELLKVDRITIYRMLQDGRMKGVKVGHQWRFSRREIERVLGTEDLSALPAQPDASPSFPTHCVQTIQDLFSEISRIGALVIDQDGAPLTQISHPCNFCQAILSNPLGQAACRASWQSFAHGASSGGKYFTCHAGLQYIAVPIMDEGEQIGFFLAGQFYWQAPDPREEDERIRRLAAAYDLQSETLQQLAHSIRIIAPEQQAALEGWPFTAARAIQSILHERIGLMARLQQIANLTQIS